MTPNFSAYPFDHLPRISRRDAALQSTVARWLAAGRFGGARLAALVGVPRATLASAGRVDPQAARCDVRAGDTVFEVRGGSAGVRAVAASVLGGPDELRAPRPLAIVERALWSLVVATALEDLGIAGEVWPVFDDAPKHGDVIELAVTLGDIALGVQIVVPAGLALRTPPPRAAAFELTFAIPIVVGRCALPARTLDQLAVPSLVTLEAPVGIAELEIFGGVVGLRATPQAVVAEVATGYVRRDMALPDDAHVELTVTLGTTQLSLRQLCDLAVGQVVTLGRPLHGPFDLRAQGRLVGRGDLVDVDGELAVRVVSLGDQE